MKAIGITNPGKNGSLHLAEYPLPEPRAGEVRIKVAASGLNRADLFQIEGNYPPPAGAPDIPGLEVSGVVDMLGEGATRYRAGDPICALLPGGGYAEYAVAPEVLVLPLPRNIDVITAASLPEACFTVWKNLFMRGRLKKGKNVLIHAGASGIGTTAIQIASALGAHVYATASSAEKQEACLELGAKAACHYQDNYLDMLPPGQKFDVILDSLGADYLPKNIAALGYKGRLVVIALLNGRAIEMDMAPVLMKNLTILGSTLRSASAREKAEIAQAVEAHVWPLYETGAVHPVIDSILPFQEVERAVEHMRQRQHTGKIVLKWQ